MYESSNGWQQRSTSNCAWGNDYYHAAPGAPQGLPKRKPTKSPMRSSLACPWTNQAPCTMQPKLQTYRSSVIARCDPDAMGWQEQALKTQAAHPSLTPVLTGTGHQYRTTWVRGVPISHKREVQVHVHHHLGVEGRLAAYELVDPTWQLKVINVHGPFRDATETFLEHHMEAYRQLAMIGRTVIIGDFKAAPSADNRGGRQRPEDTAVQMAMQHMGLQDLTACLRGQPSHRLPQPGLADSRINLCYADSAHVEVARAQYHDLPSKITGHRHVEVQIKVLQVPPASTKNNHPLDHQTSTTHTNEWRITARCSASWANKTRRTSTLPCNKRPRRAAPEENTGAHRTTPPRIKTYDPWFQPYGATSGHHTRQCTHMTRRPNMTPRNLPHGWTPRTGNSGNGTSAEQRS